ncbi:MAG: hypothetical protein ACREBG_29060 [Pyrinomonadaceae bacterium]
MIFTDSSSLVDRLRLHPHGTRVIFERSPVDFLAYILALKDRKMEDVDSGLVRPALDLLLAAIRNLDRGTTR